MEEIVELKTKLENLQHNEELSSAHRQIALKRHNSNKLAPASKYSTRLVATTEETSSSSEISCHQKPLIESSNNVAVASPNVDNTTSSSALSLGERSSPMLIDVESSPFKLPKTVLASQKSGRMRRNSDEIIECESNDEESSKGNDPRVGLTRL